MQKAFHILVLENVFLKKFSISEHLHKKVVL